MSHAQRRVRTRLWAALLASLLAFVGVGALVQPANADPVTGELETDQYAPNTEGGVRLEGEDGYQTTGLFQLRVGNKVLLAYCIDFGTDAVPRVKYKETNWDETIGKDKAGKINWILQNSVPKLSLEQIRAAIKDNKINSGQAVAGTQAAIWHFSDGKKLSEQGNNPSVVKLYEYLVENAEKNPIAEPKPALELTPATQSGKDGDKIGPFKVVTTAETIKVELHKAPKDVKLVDKNGAPATKVKDGDELFVDVPTGTEDGSAEIKATGSAKVALGRVFRGPVKDGKNQTQTMILAGTQPVEVCADAKATWKKATVPPAAPDAKAKLDCKEGGVVVTLINKGGETAKFTVEGKEYEVEGGKSREVLVKVEEDKSYSIKVTGPGEFSKTFEGERDCEKETPGPTPTPTRPSTPQPSVPGGGLADTGANNLPLQVGIGAALLLLGGGLVFFVRRRTGQQTGSES